MYFAHSVNYKSRVLRLSTPIEVFPQYPMKDSSVTVDAIWDTGATFTAISWQFAERYEVSLLDDATVDGVGGDKRGKLGQLAIKLPSGLLISNKRIIACMLPAGTDFIIGMDIITLGDFCIANAFGSTLFSSTVPPLVKPINLEYEAAHQNKPQN
jgi:hypothetical protein